MKDETILKMWGLSMLILGYFIAASHGYDGLLFTTVIGIIALAMGLDIGKGMGIRYVKKQIEEVGSGAGSD